MLVVKNNLMMPILATEDRISEISNEAILHASPTVINGLFLMLVSYIESMHKSVLIYYLKYQPESIPVKKTIEIDKIILADNEDFYLVEHLVSEFVRGMNYPQFADLFYKTLRIKKPDNEAIIGEIKKKRNEVIHKNLRVHFKHKKSEHEHIDSNYLAYSLNEYTMYLNGLKTEISNRYADCTKLNALRNMWDYTFTTPLCANFEDYWYVDTENDSIVGCKTSNNEGSLSSSERFILDIWKSQVSGCKVDFTNISSLGQHMQHCLYTFLKLSNDIFMY